MMIAAEEQLPTPAQVPTPCTNPCRLLLSSKPTTKRAAPALLSVLLFLSTLAPSSVAAFVTPAPASVTGGSLHPTASHRLTALPRQSSRVRSATPSSTELYNSGPLDGVSDFEEWFDAADGAKRGNIKHAAFDSDCLRGLEFTSTKSSDLQNVVALPRKLVLRTPYSESAEDGESYNWDANLSVALLKECSRGKASGYYGYCSLLTRGTSMIGDASAAYPPTAPDALRHWTPDQRSCLEPSEAGKRLLKVEENQTAEWKSKYSNLPANDKSEFSYERFAWAMEAVHSRAFRGDFGDLNSGEGGKFRTAASFLLPLSAIAFGLFYATDPMVGMDTYFLPLSIFAAAPVALNAIADQKGSKDAVLLPFIDSANHLEEADSVIEYDQVADAYTLSLGRKCLVKERDGAEGNRAQLCISYGVRKDAELLLNYGFLRGVKTGTDDDGEKDSESRNDDLRRRLAETFVGRNP